MCNIHISVNSCIYEWLGNWLFSFSWVSRYTKRFADGAIFNNSFNSSSEQVNDKYPLTLLFPYVHMSEPGHSSLYGHELKYSPHMFVTPPIGILPQPKKSKKEYKFLFRRIYVKPNKKLISE